MIEINEAISGLWVVRDKATGWWWRPRAMGYTQELLAAGAVDEETARSWARRKSPNRHGDCQDEAVSLADALRGLGEDTVLRAILERLKGTQL
jgi:hypothetical protein